MPELASFLAGLAAVYGGFALMALSLARHWRQAMGPQAGERDEPHPGAVLRLRASGVAMIVAGLVLMIWGNGPGFGTVLWVTSLSIGACCVVATLVLTPSWLRPIAWRCRGVDQRD